MTKSIVKLDSGFQLFLTKEQLNTEQVMVKVIESHPVYGKRTVYSRVEPILVKE